jgi:hypothetical protein
MPGATLRLIKTKNTPSCEADIRDSDELFADVLRVLKQIARNLQRH